MAAGAGTARLYGLAGAGVFLFFQFSFDYVSWMQFHLASLFYAGKPEVFQSAYGQSVQLRSTSTILSVSTYIIVANGQRTRRSA